MSFPIYAGYESVEEMVRTLQGVRTIYLSQERTLENLPDGKTLIHTARIHVQAIERAGLIRYVLLNVGKTRRELNVDTGMIKANEEDEYNLKNATTSCLVAIDTWLTEQNLIVERASLSIPYGYQMTIGVADFLAWDELTSTYYLKEKEMIKTDFIS